LIPKPPVPVEDRSGQPGKARPTYAVDNAERLTAAAEGLVEFEVARSEVEPPEWSATILDAGVTVVTRRRFRMLRGAVAAELTRRAALYRHVVKVLKDYRPPPQPSAAPVCSSLLKNDRQAVLARDDYRCAYCGRDFLAYQNHDGSLPTSTAASTRSSAISAGRRSPWRWSRSWPGTTIRS